jgi:hypothetical protein
MKTKRNKGLTKDQIAGFGSLLTVVGTDNQCLGSLLEFPGHGIYDAYYGKVEVSKADADAHNKVLDEALIKGLDENCSLGQGGTFYAKGCKITTFLGTEVATGQLVGKTLTFERAGKTFRGRISDQDSCFNFRRIA